MYKNKKIAVIVPAYNEEKYISKAIKTIPDYIDAIIVIDDASKDGTKEVVKSIQDERIILIEHSTNQGVGGAIISGHKKGLELNADINVIIAGDAQMDPRYLPLLLDSIIEENYAYVKGNRFLHPGYLKGMPKIRIFGNVVLTFLNKLASGYWNIFDPQNGYTAIKNEVFNDINLDHLHKRYAFENDMLINLNIENCRVKDVSIPAIYGEEKSHIKMVNILFTFPLFFIRGFLHRIYQKYILRSFHPIALFLIFGTILFLWGFIFGIYVIISTIGPPVASTGTVMLSLLPLLVGFELILQAIVLDIQETPK